MSRAFSRLTATIGGVNGSTARARRNVSALSGDLQTMSQILQNAQRDGSLARREFNALSNGLRLASGSARDLRRSGDLSRSSLRDVRREINRLSAQMRLLGGEGTRLGRLNDHLQLLQRRLGDVDSSAGRTRRSLARMGEGGLGGLRGAVRVLSILGNGLGNLRDRISGASRGIKMFLLAVALLAPLAAPIGAILTTILGGAFIALGAFALRGEEDVREAFTNMKSTIGTTVRAAAQPLKGPLIQAMSQVGVAVEQMGGQLTAAFTATAPLVSNMAGAFTDFVARALPGFTKSLQDMGPVIQGFREGMGTIGQGIGDMFAAMTSGGGAEGLRDAWNTMGREIKILLVSMGEFINVMSQSEAATGLLVGMFRALSGILLIVEGAFTVLDYTIVPLLKTMKDLADLTGIILGPFGLNALKDLFDDLGISGSETEGTLVRIKTAAEQSAEAFKKNGAAIDALLTKIKELNELNRTNLDARAAQRQAVLDAEKGYKAFGEALSMTNGQLNLTSQASLDAYKLLSDIAGKTNEATNAAIEAKRPWEEVHALWSTGNKEVIRFADGLGLTAEEARILADQIVKMPDFDLVYRANTQAAAEDLQRFVAAVEAAPGSKSVTLKTLSARAEQILENFGYTVKRLPDGSVTVTAATGTAKSRIEYIKSILRNLDGTVARTYIETVNSTIYQEGARGRSLHDLLSANGNIFKFFANGGASNGGENHVAQMAPAGSWRVWGEPETGGEAYIPLAETKRTRSRQVAEDTVGILGGEVQWFAKGGSTAAAKARAKERATEVARARNTARGDLRSQMGVSRFASLAGLGVSSMREGLGKPNDLASLVSALSSLGDTIKKAFSGRTESSLLKQLDRSGRALIKYEKKLTDVNKRLDAAKDKLSGLRQEANSLRESVKSGVMSATNITGAASGDKNLTVADLMTRMTQSRDKATAFSGALESLRKKGVAKEIIQQIAEAGIEGGGLETAGSLLTASASEISSINALQAQINKAAKAAGDSAAGAMYNAGIKAAEGLVNGLIKQKKTIEKAMMTIAKAMEQAIKRALGIKSPSKVMEGVGDFTAEGFAKGVQRNRNIGSAWESMLTTPSSTRASGMGGGSGNGVYVIQLNIGNKPLDEIILDSNRRTVRTRGGNVQAVYGRKTG